MGISKKPYLFYPLHDSRYPTAIIEKINKFSINTHQRKLTQTGQQQDQKKKINKPYVHLVVGCSSVFLLVLLFCVGFVNKRGKKLGRPTRDLFCILSSFLFFLKPHLPIFLDITKNTNEGKNKLVHLSIKKNIQNKSNHSHTKIIKINTIRNISCGSKIKINKGNEVSERNLQPMNTKIQNQNTYILKKKKKTPLGGARMVRLHSNNQK